MLQVGKPATLTARSLTQKEEEVAGEEGKKAKLTKTAQSAKAATSWI